MRVMVIVKANGISEAGQLPSEQALTEMGQFNEALVKAGIMLAGEGLQASAKGKRIRFGGGKTSVVDGPFAETKELVAGFWLWQVNSMEEAVVWARRIPNTDNLPGDWIEIRPVFETEDFAPNDPTGHLRAQEEQLREQIEGPGQA